MRSSPSGVLHVHDGNAASPGHGDPHRSPRDPQPCHGPLPGMVPAARVQHCRLVCHTRTTALLSYSGPPSRRYPRRQTSMRSSLPPSPNPPTWTSSLLPLRHTAPVPPQAPRASPTRWSEDGHPKPSYTPITASPCSGTLTTLRNGCHGVGYAPNQKTRKPMSHWKDSVPSSS